MRRLILATVATAALGSFAFAQTATTTSTEVFVTAKPTDVISSNILNLDIVNSKDESIGKIQDLIMADGSLTGYIVSVGGFLGIGEKYVIVAPQSVEILYSENDKKWSAKMETSKEDLEKAPEFKYEGRWDK
ncbi:MULTISPECIES: PRC-barrel domain-containing protein [Brucella/Ochrobactrum group]|uniref:PRC-barrel domain-containing protein n=1 Tax=Brucella/Ochrobactrum group TaxID=2826938 RepID=UPI0030A480ED